MPHRDYSGGIPYQSTPGHHNQPVGIDGLRKGNETRLSAASAIHGIGAAQHELGAVPKAFWVKAVVINNDIFDYVVSAEQIVGDDDFALQMLFNQRRSQSGIYPFKSVKKIPPAKGEFIDDFIAFDEIMIAHHFDERQISR